MKIGKLAFAGQLCLMLIAYRVQFKDAISVTCSMADAFFFDLC